MPSPLRKRKMGPSSASVECPLRVPKTTIPIVVKNRYNQIRLIGRGAVNNGRPNFRTRKTATRRTPPLIANDEPIKHSPYIVIPERDYFVTLNAVKGLDSSLRSE